MRLKASIVTFALKTKAEIGQR